MVEDIAKRQAMDLLLLTKLGASGEAAYSSLRKSSRLKAKTFRAAIERLMAGGLVNRRLIPIGGRYASRFSVTEKGLQAIKSKANYRLHRALEQYIGGASVTKASRLAGLTISEFQRVLVEKGHVPFGAGRRKTTKASRRLALEAQLQKLKAMKFKTVKPSNQILREIRDE